MEFKTRNGVKINSSLTLLNEYQVCVCVRDRKREVCLYHYLQGSPLTNLGNRADKDFELDCISKKVGNRLFIDSSFGFSLRYMAHLYLLTYDVFLFSRGRNESQGQFEFNSSSSALCSSPR